MSTKPFAILAIHQALPAPWLSTYGSTMLTQSQKDARYDIKPTMNPSSDATGRTTTTPS